MIVELKSWGRKVGFRFDALAAYLMCQQHGVDLSEADKIKPVDMVPSWIWNAHRSYSMFHYKKPRFTYEQMRRFIGLLRQKDYQRLIDAMQTGAKAQSDKKKVPTGTTSSPQDGSME